MWLWKYLTRPKANDVIVVPPQKKALDLSALPQTTTPGFKELVQVYDATEIEFPHLKAVTVAQWGLESGWGTSLLAKKHRNYAGAKWRGSMAPYGHPIGYIDWQGLKDQYVWFNSDANFIKAYWLRLDVISAYKGWRNHTKTPEAFISFIGPIWVGMSKEHNEKYVEHILELAEKRTNKIGL